ncbi:MAG: VRR-NUC domain-containing protein [Clostridiales bacterium]|nr:VRR-NUC domain-containing protein [Clostridiales bacterium]
MCPTEAEEQTWLFQWAAGMARLRWPELDLLHHIPNGGSRNRVEAARLKAQGVKAGIPDVCLPVPRGPFCGLYIEMKRQQGGTLSPEQKVRINQLRMQGYRVDVCKGFHAAADIIEAYMEERLREGQEIL